MGMVCVAIFSDDYLENVPKKLEFQRTLVRLIEDSDRAVKYTRSLIEEDREYVEDWGGRYTIDENRLNDEVEIRADGVAHYSYTETVGDITLHRYYTCGPVWIA